MAKKTKIDKEFVMLIVITNTKVNLLDCMPKGIVCSICKVNIVGYMDHQSHLESMIVLALNLILNMEATVFCKINMQQYSPLGQHFKSQMCLGILPTSQIIVSYNFL